MIDSIDILLHKLRYLIVSILLVAILFLVSTLLSTIADVTAKTSTQTLVNPKNGSITTVRYDDPNAVSNGMNHMLNDMGQATAATTRIMATTLQATASVAGSSLSFVGHGINTTAKFVAYGTSKTVAFIITTPGNIMGSVTDAAAVDSVIRPSAKAQVQVIDPNTTQVPKALATLTTSQVTPVVDAAPAWPLHGEITTYFGESDWPYQISHTGIDISDGKASGITAIKAYRPGTVIAAIQSSTGLGNHVIVDHGGGITSVYGHMYAIAVQVGQKVDNTTTLGLEGTTGASTGPHVHFEIRVNDTPVNPMLYISGRP
jgi:hypothetical protein